MVYALLTAAAALLRDVTTDVLAQTLVWLIIEAVRMIFTS